MAGLRGADLWGDGDFEDALVQETLDRLGDMLADDRYTWAMETLNGIYLTIDETRRITDRQLRALDNIEARVEGC